VKAPLAKIWELFEFPCGQRLAPILREQTERLRGSGALKCSGEVAARLMAMSPRTIDRLLAREREVRCLKRQRNPPVHPLLYQRVPVKAPSEWDRQEVGNLQLDYVLHCGRSTAGEYALTFSATDIANGTVAERPARRAWKQPGNECLPGAGGAPGQRFGDLERPALELLPAAPDSDEPLTAVPEERQRLGGTEELDTCAEGSGIPPLHHGGRMRHPRCAV
jgi:hypothetical protein